MKEFLEVMINEMTNERRVTGGGVVSAFHTGPKTGDELIYPKGGIRKSAIDASKRLLK